MNIFMRSNASLYAQRLTRIKWSRRVAKLGSGAILGAVKVVCPSRLYIGMNVIIDDGTVLNADGGHNSSLHIGANSVIREFAILEAHKGTIRLGDSVFIGSRCSLYGQGGITIGDNCLIATGTAIISSNHIYTSIDIPYSEQGETNIGVEIGANCWIGANCTILDGVILGDNCIVAAGAVVTKSFKGNVLIGGIPARVIKAYDKIQKIWVPAAS